MFPGANELNRMLKIQSTVSDEETMWAFLAKQVNWKILFTPSFNLSSSLGYKPLMCRERIYKGIESGH